MYTIEILPPHEFSAALTVLSCFYFVGGATPVQICDDMLEHVKGQLDSQKVHVTREQLDDIIDAVIAFTKHENVEEMDTMLCKISNYLA